MAKRPILIIPDPVLRRVAEPVTAVDDRIKSLADDMLETMYAAPGIGLAAPQIGISERLVVLDVATEDDAEPAPMVLINPEIVARSEETSVYEEGCLSIPDYTEDVERPARVTVRYLDREGAERTVDADGLLATCLQHEIDHLNGVLFVDYLSRLKRERVLKKFAKQAKLGA
ncbi:peptide deformylase [Acuticoccus sp. I52.16.1]|uniref:peptide deformylase n=1 Tax=Acuticoccus sp. I52.16.1 TaxID=2928472 RepID=UPI001FD18793|nr:peptide deformylase [Acuticoccus sp. I52.16.1]UOM35170.1 peptide deformylase [Acuticoccus sp. I52.16.1]